MKVRRILVGIDFSATAGRALTRAQSLARTFGAEIVLLHVVGPVHVVTTVRRPAITNAIEAAAAAAVEDARSALHKIESRLRRKDLRVRSLVETGSPADIIVTRAKELRADLVVIGTAGRSGLAHLLLGSVAERVVRQSLVPVLTVRAPAPRPALKAVRRPDGPRSITLI